MMIQILRNLLHSSTAESQEDDGKVKQDKNAGVGYLSMDDLRKLILTVKGE